MRAFLISLIIVITLGFSLNDAMSHDLGISNIVINDTAYLPSVWYEGEKYEVILNKSHYTEDSQVWLIESVTPSNKLFSSASVTGDILSIPVVSVKGHELQASFFIHPDFSLTLQFIK